MEIKEKNEVVEFLTQSNLIESVGKEGLADSLNAYHYTMGLKEINQKHLLKIHKLVMKKLNPRIAGKFRKCNVMVGDRICPKSIEAQKMLQEFYKKVNFKPVKINEEKLDLYSKELHILFEHAHPFEDGNGRIGRILYAWHRNQMGLKLDIIEYKNRWEYYKWF